jgi:hypothetical protein
MAAGEGSWQPWFVAAGDDLLTFVYVTDDMRFRPPGQENIAENITGGTHARRSGRP